MDRILSAFLDRQHAEAGALAAASDLISVTPGPGGPPDRYLCELRCKGLVRAGGNIVEAGRFVVGIWFPANYLREVDPLRIVSVLEPRDVWHPNVQPPFLCLGHIPPGTELVSILHQVFEIFTYQKVTMREDDALNKNACVWARANLHRFPIDARPLRRRTIVFDVDGGEPGEAP